MKCSGFGFAARCVAVAIPRSTRRLSPDQGHSPLIIWLLPAGHSHAAHRAAKPNRTLIMTLEAKLTRNGSLTEFSIRSNRASSPLRGIANA